VSELTALHQELLDYGMEDDIPLPEARESPYVALAAGIIAGPSDDGVSFEAWLTAERPVEKISFEVVSEALIDLLLLGRITIWCGPPSSNEPREVTDIDEAIGFLRDKRRYWWKTEPDGMRTYFGNVDNDLNYWARRAAEATASGDGSTAGPAAPPPILFPRPDGSAG
jgi:hypothetical protein